MILIVVQLMASQCQFGTEQNLKRLYKKKINYGNQTISWFYFSTISNITPDLLLLESKSNVDTICEVSNLKDIRLKKNELTLYFDGLPRRYQYNVFVPSHVRNLEVKIDTEWISSKK